MSAGTTTVAIVTVCAPVAGTLGGVWLGYRVERWKRKEDRDAAKAQQDREHQAAELNAQLSAVTAVLTSAAAWRRDAFAVITTSELRYVQWPAQIMEPAIRSHAAFGEAILLAGSVVSDAKILKALDGLLATYESAFDPMQQVSASSGSDASLKLLQRNLDWLSFRLFDLQVAARARFGGPAPARPSGGEPEVSA